MCVILCPVLWKQSLCEPTDAGFPSARSHRPLAPGNAPYLFPWASGTTTQQPSTFGVGDVTQFHLYTIEWDPTQIRWYIDRTTHPDPVHTVDITAANQEELHKPFHIILNLALG